jgi:hypothetical protein
MGSSPVLATGSVRSRVQLERRCGAHLKESPQGVKPFIRFKGDKNCRLGEMVVGQPTPRDVSGTGLPIHVNRDETSQGVVTNSQVSEW